MRVCSIFSDSWLHAHTRSTSKTNHCFQPRAQYVSEGATGIDTLETVEDAQGASPQKHSTTMTRPRHFEHFLCADQQLATATRAAGDTQERRDGLKTVSVDANGGGGFTPQTGVPGGVQVSKTGVQGGVNLAAACVDQLSCILTPLLTPLNAWMLSAQTKNSSRPTRLRCRLPICAWDAVCTQTKHRRTRHAAYFATDSGTTLVDAAQAATWSVDTTDSETLWTGYQNEDSNKTLSRNNDRHATPPSDRTWPPGVSHLRPHVLSRP